MIVATELTKTYAGRPAVDSISFEIPKGEIVGFLGPNGAGKSTTLRMMSGFLPPTSGSISIDGLDVQESSLQARAKIGYMPESTPLYPELRVREFLAFRAEIKGIRGGAARKRAVDRAMELTQTADRAKWLIGELSKGYRQRVALADALVAEPSVLILDEPTASLDPNQIIEVRELIKSLGGEQTIVLSTHILPEVEAMCGRVIILRQGRVAAAGSLDEIQRSLSSSHSASLTLRGDHAKAREIVGEIQGLTVATGDVVVRDEAVFSLTVSIEQAEGEIAPKIEQLVAAMVSAGLGVREVSVETRSLEDVFRELTTTDRALEETAAEAPTSDADDNEKSDGATT
ncbi:MAG: ATP-binding cassette domain-containing protein [Deltaproteobacteria bacterium]|nr:ATP-binding cassette domain-containing protein [Deltaproteobacteria bacterium]